MTDAEIRYVAVRVALLVTLLIAGRVALPLFTHGVQPPTKITPRLLLAACVFTLALGIIVGTWIGSEP